MEAIQPVAGASSVPKSFHVTTMVCAIGWAIFAFAGFLLTSLPELTPDNWQLLAGARVAGQLGLPIVMLTAIFTGLTRDRSEHRAARTRSAKKFAVFAVGLSLLLAGNPLLDLLRGPAVVTGVVRESSAGGRKYFSAHVAVEQDDELGTFQLEMSSTAAEVWSRRGCSQGERAKLVALRHLAAVLSVRCAR